MVNENAWDFASLRRLLRVDQFTVAQASEIGRTRISLFENGHILLTDEELNRLQEGMNLIIEDKIRTLQRNAAAIANVLCSYRSADTHN